MQKLQAFDIFRTHEADKTWTLKKVGILYMHVLNARKHGHGDTGIHGLAKSPGYGTLPNRKRNNRNFCVTNIEQLHS